VERTVNRMLSEQGRADDESATVLIEQSPGFVLDVLASEIHVGYLIPLLIIHALDNRFLSKQQDG
jgi:hypothetical protein